MAFTSATYCGSSGWFQAGTLKLGVRWKITTESAWRAMCGIDWMAEDPVPITPTRWPLKSTGWCGQCPVWNVGPAKEPTPSTAGSLALDRQPVAMTQ